MPELSFTPSLAEKTVARDLARLLVQGELRDPDMEGRIRRLHERFRAFVARSPAQFWTPGLVITDEQRRLTEQYLSSDEIKRAFSRLFRLSFRLPPRLDASTVHRADFWLDALDALHNHIGTPDPAAILRELMTDEVRRMRFIFANFLPERHGESFGRYPLQLRYLRERLDKRRGKVKLLDAACGTGEGTWELALLLQESGYHPEETAITGASIEPVELFAAAHAIFPHDARRQLDFRQRIAPLLETSWMERVDFRLEDIRRMADAGEYDVILCNGILGGPLLHLEEEIAATASALARRLKPGGIFLAADRFHGGWKKMVPQSMLAGLLERQGLRLVAIDDGIAAEQP
ncbi:MAG: class I SAM-dependent methyltransferase [Geobacter sp.]|nr:class I SAM-dependent methyltransferase [Geobacter sp.]